MPSQCVVRRHAAAELPGPCQARRDMPRLAALSATAIAIFLALGAIVMHAEMLRNERDASCSRRARLAAGIGLPDLALSSGARWLRHPSQVEPAAAISDAPGALDVDPAGAWISPPRAVLAAGARGTLEVR